MVRRLKAGAGAALLVVFGLGVGLLLAEMCLRLLGISNPVFDTYDPDRGVKLRPGKRGWYRKEGNAFIAVNSLGYRDVEHLVRKPPGVYRISFLGDSFTEARQVDIADTYWKLLESKLTSCGALAGRRVEALNFGVGGYGTAQELLTLRIDVLRLHPDLVVLAFLTGNDVANNSRALDDGYRPYFVFREGRLVPDSLFRTLSFESCLQRFLLWGVHYSRALEVLNQYRRSREVRRWRQEQGQLAQGGNGALPSAELGLWDLVYRPPPDAVWTEAWRVTEALIELVHRECVNAGAAFVLVTLTNSIQVDPDSGKTSAVALRTGVDDLFYPERRLRGLGERLGFPVVTLAPQLQAIAVDRRLYFHGFDNTVVGTGHWNETGHRYAADLLARELCDRGLIR